MVAPNILSDCIFSRRIKRFGFYFAQSFLISYFFMKIAVVENNGSMNKLPKVEGLLSYRSDDRKLYLKEKSQWEALAIEKEVSCT